MYNTYNTYNMYNQLWFHKAVIIDSILRIAKLSVYVILYIQIIIIFIIVIILLYVICTYDIIVIILLYVICTYDIIYQYYYYYYIIICYLYTADVAIFISYSNRFDEILMTSRDLMTLRDLMTSTFITLNLDLST